MLEAIRSKTYKAEIEAIRSVSSVSARGKRLKSRLPAYAPAGVFTKVAATPGSLQQPSGIVTLDLDDVRGRSEHPDLLRERLAASPHVLSVFRSPSGKGLKVMVPVMPRPTTNQQMKAAYAAVARELQVEKMGLDKACGDIARLCFVSYDPSITINGHAIPLALNDLAGPVPVQNDRGLSVQREAGSLDRIPEGQRHNTLLSLAGVLHCQGMGEEMLRSTLHHVNTTFADPPEDEAHVDALASYVAGKEPGERGALASFLRTLGAGAPEAPGREMLVVKPAADWVSSARSRPMPRPIVGSLLFEGELTILFATSNVGKSVLAVQIADCISKGRALLPFEMETAAKRVLYLDCELSDQQFTARSTAADGTSHAFSDRFFRAEINPVADVNGRLDQAVMASLEREIVRTGAEVVIVDNLTYLKSETQEAKDATALMHGLGLLKRRLGITLLVLAHTPKRNDALPLTMNDLAGSRMLMNFADAAFTIGKCAGAPQLRYLKQIKVRSAGEEYGEDKVVVFRLERQAGLLRFAHEGFAAEADLLTQRPSPAERDERDARIAELHAKGRSLRDIAAEVGMSHMSVKRALERTGAKTSGNASTGPPDTPPADAFPFSVQGEGACEDATSFGPSIF